MSGWLHRGAVVVLAIAHLAYVVTGMFVLRLWEDEAYNLTVPVNMAGGLGYASDGVLSTGSLDLFDVRISTGPVVLVPIAVPVMAGIDPVLAGRAVVAAFWLGLVVALYLLGRRLTGRIGGLIAAGLPLLFDGSTYPSPLQGPTDILGEVPAAFFIVLFLAYWNRRPALAALALGLAIQCKLLVVVLAPVAVAALWWATRGHAHGRRRWGRWAADCSVIVAPTAVFETIKLLVLGADDYISTLRDSYYFLRSGGQEGNAASPLTKLDALLESWILPAPIVLVGVAVILLAAGLAVARTSRRGDIGCTPGTSSTVLVASAMIISWLAWWLLSTGLPAWVRHPSPVLLGALPIVVAAAARTIVDAVRNRLHGSSRVLTVACASLAIVGLAGAATRIVATTSGSETLPEQRAVASVLRTVPTDTLRGEWGVVPTLPLLAGKRSIALEKPGPGVPLVVGDGSIGAGLCGRVVVRTADYEVCRPR